MPTIINIDNIENKAFKVQDLLTPPQNGLTEEHYPSAQAVIDYSAGKKTSEGGTIFNNYDSNISGCYGYKLVLLGEDAQEGTNYFVGYYGILDTKTLGNLKVDLSTIPGAKVSLMSNSQFDDIGTLGNLTDYQVAGYTSIITILQKSKLNAQGIEPGAEVYMTYVDYPTTGELITDEKYQFVSGTENIATKNASAVFGRGNKALGRHAFVTGRNNTANFSAFAAGRGNYAKGQLSTAVGGNNVASGYASFAEGGENEASEVYTHAEGNYSKATYMMAHAEGYKTLSSSHSTHSEGIMTIASGYGAHAEGAGNIASGIGSHAEGGKWNQSTNSIEQKNVASGIASHAEGMNTTASGDTAHAEGQGTFATANYTHAEGIGTKAIKLCAHAEGHTTLAGDETAAWNIGTASHAEGYLTKAFGSYSHAEGQNTLAQGENSHASGLGTRAIGDNQTVVGKYNVDTTNALFVVGAGLSDEKRYNAFMVNSDSVYCDVDLRLSQQYPTISGFDKLQFIGLSGFEFTTGAGKSAWIQPYAGGNSITGIVTDTENQTSAVSLSYLNSELTPITSSLSNINDRLSSVESKLTNFNLLDMIERIGTLEQKVDILMNA